jgi:hypothetical protein
MGQRRSEAPQRDLLNADFVGARHLDVAYIVDNRELVLVPIKCGTDSKGSASTGAGTRPWSSPTPHVG